VACKNTNQQWLDFNHEPWTIDRALIPPWLPFISFWCCVSSSVETCHNFPLELKQWICLLQVGLAMVVVESAVTSIYICYAEDPLLIHRWDAEFFNQLSEALHQRLQHRSSRAREVLTQNRLNVGIQENVPLWQASPKQILSRNTHCNSLYYIPSIEVLESFCFSLVWDLDCIQIRRVGKKSVGSCIYSGIAFPPPFLFIYLFLVCEVIYSWMAEKRLSGFPLWSELNDSLGWGGTGLVVY
jgi:hypothetical protein